MSYYLNIGLNIPGTDKTLPLATVYAVVEHVLGERITVALAESDTEKTLVFLMPGDAVMGSELLAPMLSYLSGLLLQDCIAMMPEGDPAGGQLYGPKAAEWGPFNPAYFLLPDGTRAG